MSCFSATADPCAFLQLKKPAKFSQPPSGRTSQALCKAAAYAAKEMLTEKVAVFTESGDRKSVV